MRYMQKYNRNLALFFSIVLLTLSARPFAVSAAGISGGGDGGGFWQTSSLFPDIEGHWAENSIMYCYDQGLINVYEDKTVRPGLPITRAEFAYSMDKWFSKNRVLLTQLDIKYEQVSVSFEDVKAGDTYYNSIMSVSSIGLMGGSEGYFRPDDSLTRQEVSVIWVNLFKLLNNIKMDESYVDELDSDAVLSKYADEPAIAPWAREAVAIMTDNRFVSGYPDGSFLPENHITRAEAYMVLANIEFNLKYSMKVEVAANYDENDIRLIRVSAKNIGKDGFDLEFTVNDAAVEKDASVVLAYTSDPSLIVDADNFETLRGLNRQTFKLSAMDVVSIFAFQGIYSMRVKADFPNVYYVYVILKSGGAVSEVRNCVVWLGTPPIVRIIPGGNYTLAMSADSQLWGWGDNSNNQLAVSSENDDEDYTSFPIPVKIMDDVSNAWTNGAGSSFAVKTNGELWGWGFNENAQLGCGDKNNKTEPALIMEDVVSLSLTRSYAYAVKSNGELWSWGENDFGQLGSGSARTSLAPVKVMDNVASVAAGYYYSAYAVDTEGNLWGWGNSEFGQLGSSSKIISTRPVWLMDGVSSVSSSDTCTFALKTNGELWGWGDNRFGELGSGAEGANYKPVKILDGVSGILANKDHTFAVKSNGELWGWGYNHFGELGDATAMDSTAPKKIMDDILQVVSGKNHTLALKTNGELWTWGRNYSGQLGTGTFDDVHEAEHIMNRIGSIAASEDYSMAISVMGELWGWGGNSSGQVGDGTNIIHSYPVPVTIPYTAEQEEWED